jgi:hypothetical protein
MKAKGNEQSIVNGARQKEKKVIPDCIEPWSLDPVGHTNHYTTNTSWKK